MGTTKKGAHDKNSIRRRRLKVRLSEAQNHRCCYCGVQLVFGGTSPQSWTFEHVRPRAHGGKTSFGNCVIACRACNEARDTMPVREFLKQIAPPDPGAREEV